MEAAEVYNSVWQCAFTASLWGSDCRKGSEIWADCLWDNFLASSSVLEGGLQGQSVSAKLGE